MRRWRSGFGAARATWATYVRGEYPGVSGALAMIPNRCALRAAWYTPILDERKARRVFERMKGRLVEMLDKRADAVRGSGDEQLLRYEASRLRGTEFVIADRVACKGSAGCFRPAENTIYFRRSHFAWTPGMHGPYDPFRQMSHGALVHELAHAAASTPTKVTRFFAYDVEDDPATGLKRYVPGPPKVLTKVRRSPHGHRFVGRLAQAVRAWCETEGKPVCEHYCAPGRRW